MLDCVANLCPIKLYERAKYVEKLQFNQFSEWIENEIQKQMYRRDNQFFEMETNHMIQEKIKQKKQSFEFSIQNN